MSFFDRVERPRPPEAPREHEPPPWFAPPPRHLAALVGDRRVVVRAEGVAVLLSHIDVFPTGCSIRVRASMVRPDGMSEEDWQDRLHREVHGRHFGGRGEREGQLRFGVDLGDGGWAVTDQWRGQHEDSPDGPVLQQRGGSSGGGRGEFNHNRNLWLWPLPPPRPFDLVLAWQDQGVEETRVELDGAAIVEAAADSRPLFD